MRDGEYIYWFICDERLVIWDFFAGNAGEFLSGPIYDLNQTGQVVAGELLIFFIKILIFKLFLNPPGRLSPKVFKNLPNFGKKRE